MSRQYYSPAMQATAHNYIGMSLANTPMLVISKPLPQRPLRAPRTTPYDRRKRYGMVFDTNPLYGRRAYGDDDDESTWSMSRSRWSRRIATDKPASMRGRNSSPAQEIAARYRASHYDDDHSRTYASSSVTYLDLPSVDALSPRTSIDTAVSAMSGPRLHYRQSRADAMDQAAREAYVMAIRCASDRDIPCQRPGCRDILPNIRSLASHLAIHDIDPAERYYAGFQYGSFLDFGHTVGGRQRRRYVPSPAPYARSMRKRSKMRKYLSMITCHSISCSTHYDDFDL
ncbi:hypothetical protein BN946_scf184756.g4 [Trametes cinnabarina]|uniref:Uncharacterized protein n=1 Tax=Pycnoporus cinnabarinus TaxID=5643 RepID=A0A060SE21_PYCCI|nr:hypothetical protein BN946_scf184756.g4 [Trametes cinnabarina]